MVWFWWEPSSWLPDGCLLIVSSHSTETACYLVSPPIGSLTHYESPTLVTSSKPNHLPKTIFKLHPLGGWSFIIWIGEGKVGDRIQFIVLSSPQPWQGDILSLLKLRFEKVGSFFFFLLSPAVWKVTSVYKNKTSYLGGQDAFTWTKNITPQITHLREVYFHMGENYSHHLTQV